MIARTKAPESSRLRREIRAMSSDMHRLGIMDDETYRKITMREVRQAQKADQPSDDVKGLAYQTLTGADIRALRERAKMSQAVFARCLNLTAGYVSQLERGAKRPSGPALALLDLIRRKGIEAIL